MMAKEEGQMPKTRTVRDIMNDLIDIHARSTDNAGACRMNGWIHCRPCHLAEAIRLINEWLTEQEKVRGVGNV